MQIRIIKLIIAVICFTILWACSGCNSGFFALDDYDRAVLGAWSNSSRQQREESRREINGILNRYERSMQNDALVGAIRDLRY